MFDIAFSEMLVIAVIALIVIGPEKLPKVARTLGLLVGRMQRYVATVRADVERELRTEDLSKMQAEARQQVAALETAIRREVQIDPGVVDSVMTAGDADKTIKNDVSSGPA